MEEGIKTLRRENNKNASNYESGVLIDPCQVICFIIIRQGCSLEVFPVELICIQL